MLSIGKLRLGREDYYLASVARGTKEYYTAHGDAPGQWIASSTKSLGLSGEVAGDDLRTVLAGTDPYSGDSLGSSRRTRPGFDLCFSAPKSVSLLFAFGDTAVRARVVEAHESAVAASLDYLEREACWVRRGHAGARRIRADGFIAAAFRHRTSRAGDPQLHTHVLVANAARGTDGRWSALDAHFLYWHAKTAGYLYQAHLRHDLGRQLGVRWGPVVSGSAELIGIPSRVLKAFSQRRDEIKQEMAERGVTGRHGAQVATLATRQPKDHDTDIASLQLEWEHRAAALGFDPAEFRSLVGRNVEPEAIVIDHVELAEALTTSASTFERADTLRAVAERARAGATVEQVEANSDAFLASDRVVRLADGVYTTPQMLRLENAILTNAQSRLRAGTGVTDPAIVEAELAARLRLSNEQARMVRLITGSGNGVDVVLGAAGAGKTSGLECARAAWETSGYHVIGVALAARAAAELQAQSGIGSGTLDALLTALDQAGSQLPARAVVVLDEAGMVDTRRLARLLAHANAADAKVVLVGDDHQLPEIEAGGAFAALLRRLPAVVLTENRRQEDPIDRRTLAELRTGNAEAAVQRLVANGRIAIVDSAEAAREQMVRDWLAARTNGEDAVMLAVRRVDVHELNRLARTQLIATGEVHDAGIDDNGREFAVGDRVMALSNRHGLGVVNGARGTLSAAGETGVTVRFDDGATVSLPASYLEAGHLTHAYATTIHKAQGMTCDRALVLASDALFQEAGYTALSRGRKENRLYLVAPDPPDVDVGHGVYGARDDPLDGLVSALEHSRRKHLALDRLVHASPAPAAAPPAPGIGIGP